MEDCLSLAVHAMNSTAGPNGLVPILLVFGVVPQIPFGFSDVPEQRERMRILKSSRDEMVKAVAKSRLHTALIRKVPSAADSTIEIGAYVLFFREKSKMWEGPYLVIAGDKKKLWLNIKGNLKEVSIDKVKEFTPDLSNMRKSPSKTSDISPEHHSERNLTEIDNIFDQIITEFIKAKKSEIQGLKSRGTWKAVHASKVPKDANVIGGRFVCEVKNFGTPKAKAKASSVKILVSMAAVMTYRIACLDFVQAYLQSSYGLSRQNLCDYWGATFNRYVKDELQMISTNGDPALYTLAKDSTTTGILGAYVDDSIFAVGPGFEHVIDRIMHKFDSKSLEWDDVEFLGIRVKVNHFKGDSRSIDINQPEYLSKLSAIPSDISYERFRSVRACLAWLSHSRPDLCCSINRAAQVTSTSFELRHVKELNKAIRYAKSSTRVCLSYPKLEKSTLHLRTYADASFATNDDGSSQLGYLILLCDSKNGCHILSYSSRKSRRIVRSIMAGETYAFTDAFDQSYIIKWDLEKILYMNIPLRMFTDSKQLFDVITKASHPTEKRLMIDIASVREAYDEFEISNVGLVSGASNPADALTKPNFSSTLLNIMTDSKDNTPVLQWIFRTR
eukprot:IDg23435t1